jgi:hypothetical protein
MAKKKISLRNEIEILLADLKEPAINEIPSEPLDPIRRAELKIKCSLLFPFKTAQPKAEIKTIKTIPTSKSANTQSKTDQVAVLRKKTMTERTKLALIESLLRLKLAAKSKDGLRPTAEGRRFMELHFEDPVVVQMQELLK